MLPERGFFVKKLAWLLVFAMLCGCAPAWAEEAAIRTEASPHAVRYSFDLPSLAFAYVTFDTKNDEGSRVLYSPNGHFEGVCDLPGTVETARLGLNVYALNGKQLLQTRLDVPADPEPAGPAAGLPAEQAVNRIQELTVTAGDGGIHYRFRVPGRDSVVLRCKSPQEWHRITLYAGANYLYEGDVAMPCTYADDAVTITMLTTSGNALYEGSVLMPYTPPALPDTLTGDTLRGVTVCIDPGHQRTTQVETVQSGPNFNRTTTTTIGMAKGVETKRMESQLVLEIGMQLRNALMAQGASVCVTRDMQDTFVGMLERSDIPNSISADFVLRLHCNSRSSNPDVQGIEVYSPLMSSYAHQVAEEAEYRRMAETMLQAMQDATGMHKGAYLLNDNYVGNNWSRMPSFLIEMGYMTNMEEDLLLSCPAYQQRLVQGMVQGVIELARMRGLID